MPKLKFTKADDEFIIKNYSLLGLKGCAEHLNRCSGSIQYRRKYLGIPKLTSTQLSNLLLGKTKPKSRLNKNVSESQFINIQTPEAAYILGLLWADGYVKKGEKIVITGVTEDLSDCLNLFRITGNWKIQKYKRDRYGIKTKEVLRITTSNINLVEYLETKGYRSKSTDSACLILDTIPDHLKHYWFRGLFDGDGHINIAIRDITRKNQLRIGISSSYYQNWIYLENICSKLNIRYGIYRRRVNRESKVNSSSSFSIQNLEGCNKFLNYIYQNYENDKIGIKRKYNKWKSFIV